MSVPTPRGICTGGEGCKISGGFLQRAHMYMGAYYYKHSAQQATLTPSPKFSRRPKEGVVMVWGGGPGPKHQGQGEGRNLERRREGGGVDE